MEQYEKDMLERIDSGEKLSEKEIKMLVGEFEEIYREEGDDRRWSKSIFSVVKIDNRCFAINWEKGLTECQENEYDSQPVEVEKKTYEKTITGTEWISKKKTNQT